MPEVDVEKGSRVKIDPECEGNSLGANVVFSLREYRIEPKFIISRIFYIISYLFHIENFTDLNHVPGETNKNIRSVNVISQEKIEVDMYINEKCNKGYRSDEEVKISVIMKVINISLTTVWKFLVSDKFLFCLLIMKKYIFIFLGTYSTRS